MVAFKNHSNESKRFLMRNGRVKINTQTTCNDDSRVGCKERRGARL